MKSDATRPASLWRDTASARAPSPPLTGKIDADLVVIGTGFTGLSAAIEAARRGSSVVVPVLSWQMASTQVGDNLRGGIVPGRQTVSDMRGDLRFFRYDARNRLITGGAVTGSWNQQERVKREASAQLAEAYPQLGEPELRKLAPGYLGWLKRKNHQPPQSRTNIEKQQ